MSKKVFIAYQGTYGNGSLLKAREIYNLLFCENNIDCYFYPETGGGNFGNTTKEAAHCDLFLIVANKNFCEKLDKNGELLDDDPIYEELNAFYQTHVRGHKNSIGLIRVYCYDGFFDYQADMVFPVATKNVEHFDEKRDGGEEKSFTKLVQWIIEKDDTVKNNRIENNKQLTSTTIEMRGDVNQRPKAEKAHNTKLFLTYFIKQYRNIIILFLFLPLNIVIDYFIFINVKEIIFSVCLIIIMFVFSAVFSFAIDYYLKTRSVGFRTFCCSSIFGKAKPQEIMKTTKRKLRFLGIASSKWLSDEKAFEDFIRRVCSENSGGIEILLLNPYSEYVKRMDIASNPSKKSTSQTIFDCLSTISKISKKICSEYGIKEISNFQIRLYSEFPIYRLAIIDDEHLYFSFYNTGSDGKKITQIEISGKQDNPAFKGLMNYYNQLWNDEGTVIYNYMEENYEHKI